MDKRIVLMEVHILPAPFKAQVNAQPGVWASFCIEVKEKNLANRMISNGALTPLILSKEAQDVATRLMTLIEADLGNLLFSSGKPEDKPILTIPSS